MLIAIMLENMRCYKVDRARYHDAMDEYWARKRRERLLDWLLPIRRRSARWTVRSANKKSPTAATVRGKGKISTLIV